VTGLHDTDICLDTSWQLTQAADGDAPLCSALDCLYQNIALEALTQPGDLFYDEEFGWGLYDFLQSEDSELVRLEIAQRVKRKLEKREVLLPGSVHVQVDYREDTFRLCCEFRFSEEDTGQSLNVIIGPVSVEVITA